MKKKLLSLILCTAMTAGIVACGNTKKPDAAPSVAGAQTEITFTEEDSSTETGQEDDSSEAEDESYKNKPSYKAIEAFADSLAKEDYEAMFSLVYLPENSVLTVDDISYTIARTDYADLIGSDSIPIEGFDNTSTSAYAEIGAGQSSVSVQAVLDEKDNQWRIDIPGLYIRDVRILAPGKAQVSLNGVDLDMDSAVKHSNGQGRVVYTVTVPNRQITGVTKTVFGDLEKVMVQRDEDDEADFTICPETDDALSEEVLEAIKSNVNAILALYEAGDLDVSNWQPYFSEKTSAEDIRAVQDAMKEMHEWNSKINQASLSSVLSREGHKPWVSSNDTVSVNVQFETRFSYESQNLTGGTSRVFGFFVMEKTDNGWVFSEQYPISSNFVPRATNSMTRDW